MQFKIYIATWSRAVNDFHLVFPPHPTTNSRRTAAVSTATERTAVAVSFAAAVRCFPSLALVLLINCSVIARDRSFVIIFYFSVLVVLYIRYFYCYIFSKPRGK